MLWSILDSRAILRNLDAVWPSRLLTCLQYLEAPQVVLSPLLMDKPRNTGQKTEKISLISNVTEHRAWSVRWSFYQEDAPIITLSWCGTASTLRPLFEGADSPSLVTPLWRCFHGLLHWLASQPVQAVAPALIPADSNFSTNALRQFMRQSFGRPLVASVRGTRTYWSCLLPQSFGWLLQLEALRPLLIAFWAAQRTSLAKDWESISWRYLERCFLLPSIALFLCSVRIPSILFPVACDY